MAVKNILCFGDSNTYGLNIAANPKRFDRRWTRELQNQLGSDYYVIEDGLCGRSAACSSAQDSLFCGCETIFCNVRKHLPLDMVIISLGTNDLKKSMHITMKDAVDGLEKCVEQVRLCARANNFSVPKVMLVAPTPLNKNIFKNQFGDMFDGENAIAISKEMAKYIKILADSLDCIYLDAAEYVNGGTVDGLHFAEDEHIKFAELLAKKLREIL